MDKNEWINKIVEATDKSREEVEEEIRAARKKYKEFTQNSEALSAMIVAKQYGIKVERARARDLSVKEALSAENNSNANLYGMLIGLNSAFNKIRGSLIQDGWGMRISMYEDNLETAVDDFDVVKIKNAMIKNSEGYSPVILVTSKSELTKAEPVDFKEMCIKPDEEVTKDRVVYFKGVVVNVAEFPYQGCPQCLRKVKNEICEECDEEAETFSFKSISITDGVKTLYFRGTPTQNLPLKLDDFMGEPVIAIGHYDSETLRIEGGSIILGKSEEEKPNATEESGLPDWTEPEEEAQGREEMLEDAVMNYLHLYSSLKYDAPIKLLKTKYKAEKDEVISVIDRLEEKGKVTIKEGTIYPKEE